LLDGNLGIQNLAFNQNGAFVAADSLFALTVNNVIAADVAGSIGATTQNVAMRPEIGGNPNQNVIGLAVNEALRSMVLQVTPGRTTTAGIALTTAVATASNNFVTAADFRAFMAAFNTDLVSGTGSGAYGTALATGVPADFAALLAFDIHMAPTAAMTAEMIQGITAARAMLISTVNNVDVSSSLHIHDNLWFQVGANLNQGVNVNLNAVNAERLGIGFRDASGQAQSFINVSQTSGEILHAQVAILDNALAMATAERSRMGAIQNRLEFTIENVEIASENLSAANSRIRDADMAREMMRLTQMNVLQQAATSMLAQANQMPQMILQLLG
jgi:flagellin